MLFKLTIDCVLMVYDSTKNKIKILLIKRGEEPENGKWALPGGFVGKTETFEETAKEILIRETSVKNVFLRQLKAYGLTDPSTNNRIASIAYYSLIKYEDINIEQTHYPLKWFDIKKVPRLPFDHGEKVKDTIKRIKELVQQEPIVFHLLPSKFPLNRLQKFYEELYDMHMDNRNFRKKLQKLPYIEKLNQLESDVSYRPSYLYRFNNKKYLSYINSRA